MLKIENIKDKTGKIVYLPEDWHAVIAKKLNIEDEKLPYQFEITDEDIPFDQKVYLCKATKEKTKFKLLVSESIIRYLYGEEVPDSNIGFSFKEFLPLENTAILITGKNPSDVTPATVEFRADTVEIEWEDKSVDTYLFIDFIVNYMNSIAYTTIDYYLRYPRGTWKFLFNEDNSYMTDYEKMFQDTFIHKTFVKKSCKKLADYLTSQGATHHAELLMQRAETHDNSKVTCADELYALSTIINDKSCLQDAKKALSQLKTDAIKLHWKHNSHHPEHYKNYADMEKIDIMEMVCDWHARSEQYHTNLMEFLETRQADRFHFPQYMYDEIKHYCEILIRE